MLCQVDSVGMVEARVVGRGAAATEAVGWEVAVASAVARRAVAMVVLAAVT